MEPLSQTRRPQLRSGGPLVTSLALILPAAVLGLPVGVQDDYTISEDVTLLTESGPLVSADFDSGSSNTVSFDGDWDYLDLIENSEGAAQTYPTDDSSQAWNSVGFDPATSTIGPWDTTAFPVQGGTIDGFPGTTPDTLGGIGTSQNGLNLITTYLFRNTFTLTAAQAAETNWIANLLADDGCVIHLNGAEVARPNMDQGNVTTETFAFLSDEGAYVDATLNVGGTLVTGTNTIAIELHQSTLGSSDVGLDLSLNFGSSPTGGFIYADDVFGTSRPGFATGDLDATGGFSGAGLFTRVGGRPAFGGDRSTSGGWARQFSLGTPATVTISFRYRLVFDEDYENDEFGEAVFELDGTRLGNGPEDSLARFTGGGNGGGDDDTGWQLASFDIPLGAGTHTMVLGAYSSKSTATGELTTTWFDDVDVSIPSSGGGVLENDTVGANPTATVVSLPTHGSLNFPESGIFTYTPAQDFFGPDSFTYEITDDSGTSSPVTVNINVLAVNDPPVAADNSYDVVEDTQLVISDPPLNLLTNDSDVDLDSLTAVLETTTSEGTLSLDSNGTFTYDPNPNFVGTDTFTYRASDGTDQSAPATVSITVVNVLEPPTPQDDAYEVEENQPLIVDQLVGGIPETIVAPGSEWKYDDTGTDLLAAWRDPAYDDSGWLSGLAELGYGDGDEVTEVSFGGDEDNKHPTTYFRRTFPVTEIDRIEACTLWIRRDDGCVVFLNGAQVAIENIEDDPVYSTLASIAGDDGNTEFEFSVDPALFVEGNNTLAVEIHQNTDTSSDITFDLRMEVIRTVDLGVLFNDTDPDGLPLTAVLTSTPTNGTTSLNPDGTFTYMPAVNFEGPDSFTYSAENGNFGAPATVTITVTPGPNNLPVTAPDTYAPTEETPFSRTAQNGVLANDIDPDGDQMTAVQKSPPSNGTLVLNPNGSFSYTPFPNFFGTDTFTYVAADGTAESPPEIVTLNVANLPDAPITLPDVYTTNPGQQLFVVPANGVLANDLDPDRTVPTAQLVSDVASGTLTLYPNGSFLYVPANANPGAVTFTYRADNGALLSPPTTVTIFLDTAPVASVDSYTATEDQPLIIPAASGLLENDDDDENDPLTAVLHTAPAHGTLALAPDGSFTYTPEQDYNGPDSFIYRASDGPRTSPPAVVSLTVNPVNDAPIGANDSYTTIAEQPLVIDASAGVLANDTDIDSPSLTASLVTQPAQGAVTLNPDGSFSYDPPVGFIDTDSFTYQAFDGLLPSSPVTVTIQYGGLSDSIIINEIMYHPASELDSHEYIELTNLGDGPVNLDGWSFTAGITYDFPDVSIPAHGYLVIAADPAAFTLEYGPVDHLVGGWIGALSNRGERIRLADSTGEQVDELEYSDEGDWATRIRITSAGEPGWTWVAAHDGGGSSLELVHAPLTNRAGANWLSSIGAPTPGAANTVAQPETSIAPLILDVEHSPRVPKSTDLVTILAELRDTSEGGLVATLHYRVSAADPPAFSTAAMADDGLHADGDPNDGLFGAALPAMPDGTIVEFYITATDGTNTRTWPAPTSVGQVANALYQVDDETPPVGEGIYRLILSVPENALFTAIDRDSNAMMNCTLVADDCSGPVIRYLCGMRVRGASSRRDTPPPMRVRIPRDRPWNGTTAMNLNSQFTWLQFIGMKLFQASDLPAPDSRRVAVRRNGVDWTTGDVEDFGSFVYLQPLSGDFIDDKIPDDRQGNLYKKVRPDRDWAYRDGDFAQYPVDGWSKETNSSEDNWTDLNEFLRVMNEAPGAPDYIAQVEAVANLDQWMRWFAVEALIANGETNASNGADDDYSIYRGAADPRFIFLPHDLDTILSYGDGSRLENPEHTIFDMLERGDVLDPLDDLFSDPAIITRYHEALRDLIQTSFSKPRFDSLIRNHLAGWAPQADIDAVIAFMDARRAYITGLVDAELGPPPAITNPVTEESLEIARGNLYLSEILAINTSSHPNAGTFPDYIELHNSGGSPIPLAGFSLSDDPALPDKFVIPAGTTIGINQHLLLYADSETGDPGIHLGFGLSRDGEEVSLYDPSGTLVDSILFGIQAPDLSIGRSGVAGTSWALNTPTPGAPNSLQPLGNPATLLLNEWLAKPDLIFDEDFIELYNPDALPVSLGGLAISDDPLNAPRRAVLPTLSFIAGSSFALFQAVGSSNASPGNSAELPFKLEADQSWIAIYGSNGVEIDRVHSTCDGRDQSQGRETDGAPLFARFGLPTPGVSNSTDLSAALVLLQSLRITEIMYHPANILGSDAEFIELRNVGPDPINLLGISFTRGIRFDFPDRILAPGEYVVVVADRTAFESIYGPGINVAGEWSGKLDNDNDHMRLEIDALNAAILDFTYRDSWYPSTDGNDFTLVIIDDRREPGSWDLKASWTAGGTLQGTPGTGEGLIILAGADQVVNLPASATLNATVFYGPIDPQTVTLNWSLENGPAAVQFGNSANEDTTVIAPEPGRYTFELTVTPQAGPIATGLVTVTFRETYANWATTNFGSPAAPGAGKLDDDDLDGFVNLIEFVLGLDPNSADPGGLLQPVISPGGSLSLTYFRPYIDDSGITVIPEVSSDLEIWQQGPGFVSETILGSTADGEFVEALDLSPVSANPARFLRLRVECKN